MVAKIALILAEANSAVFNAIKCRMENVKCKIKNAGIVIVAC